VTDPERKEVFIELDKYYTLYQEALDKRLEILNKIREVKKCIS